MKILVVEDYVPLRTSITQILSESGYQVDDTGDGTEALHLATKNTYTLAIIDIMLPGTDGLEVLRAIRSAEKETAVLIITARDSVDDRVKGLDAGADDYLVKPFSLEELTARVRALLRRANQVRDPVIRVADLELDTRRRSARRGGTELELTSKEYALLELLMLRTGQVVTRSDVWEQLYDFDQEMESNVIDVFVAYLRKKVERPGLAKLIHTRRGQGYILEERVGEVTPANEAV
jgi:two-component system, OmpR family, copper resistance phosphate regulon response regulator CusR